MKRQISTHKIICWQFTRKCNRSCSFCLSDSNPERDQYEKDIVQIISRLKELGVEKISYSGGEPLMHPQIFDAIHEGRRQGLDQVLTTNGDALFNHDILESKLNVLDKLEYIKLSYYGNQALHDSIMSIGHYDKLGRLSEELNSYNIVVGANFLLTNKSMVVLEEFLQDALKLQIKQILILTPVQNPKNADIKLQIENIEAITYLLKAFLPHFIGGIKIHNYSSYSNFTLLLDDKERIFSHNNIFNLAELGSIFHDCLNIDNRKIKIEQYFEEMWQKRLETRAIIPMEQS